MIQLPTFNHDPELFVKSNSEYWEFIGIYESSIPLKGARGLGRLPRVRASDNFNTFWEFVVMFRCYNPSCCLRQKGNGFSWVGLHSHFRSNPSCESHFIAWQQCKNRSSGEPVLALGPGEDPESHSQFNHDRTNACSDLPNMSNNGNGEDVHTENLDDKSTDSENTRYTRSEAVYGSEEEDMEPDGRLPVPDMEEEEMEDSSQLPEAEIKDASPGILESSAKKPVRPNNIYDFRVQNTISAFEWVQQWVSWSKSLGEDSTEHHPSGKPDDLSLLELLLEDPNYFAQWHCVSEVE